jgi:16S rRNA (cytosine1402-N4)-methyltransferase
MHFDEAERGFSLRLDGPLDMRFDTRSGKTAADILNYAEEKEIYEIMKNYGEEPQSKKIAREIIQQRKIQKFQTTKDLTEFLDTKIHTNIKIKTRVFQSLRIEVNKELEVLEKSLSQAVNLLQSHGKIFVISFHSLEDRIVKHFFQKEARDCICKSIICTC